jgi:hypothetical protein
LNLSGAVGIGTVVHNLALGFDHLGAAFWAGRALLPAIENLFRKAELFFLSAALAFYWAHHLGYYLTGSLDINPVAFANILASDIVFIM